MIGHLRGTVLRPGVIEAGGIGWVVRYSGEYPAGSEVSLYITSVWGRTGELLLYGFADPEEQEVFVALSKAPRVGAAAALALLRYHGSGGVAEKLRGHDAAGLARAPGVGRKTADTIIATVHLREDLVGTAGADPLVGALVGLGYTEAEAQSRLATARETGATDEGELLKLALGGAN